jgi:hypothetical protein
MFASIPLSFFVYPLDSSIETDQLSYSGKLADIHSRQAEITTTAVILQRCLKAPSVFLVPSSLRRKSTNFRRVEAGGLSSFDFSSCVQSTDEYIQSGRQTRSEKLAEIPAVQGELKYFHELMEELEKKDKDADRECLVSTLVAICSFS